MENSVIGKLYTPFIAEGVHYFHYAEAFPVGHETGFRFSFPYGVDAGLDLVFESGYLLRCVLGIDQDMVAGIDVRLERIVDVVQDYVSFFTVDDALSVIGAAGRGHELGHASVTVLECDAVLQVDSGFRFNAAELGSYYPILSGYRIS